MAAVQRAAWTDNQCKFIENASSRQSLPAAVPAPSRASVGIAQPSLLGVAMLKRLAICCALVLAAGSSSAHEREAILQKIEVPGANFEMLVATAKQGGAIYDLAGSPDALVIHLIGGKLWVGFDDAAKMLETIDTLHRPLGSLHAEEKEADPI